MLKFSDWQGSCRDFIAFVTGLKHPESYKAALKMQPVEVDEELYYYFLGVCGANVFGNGFQVMEPVYTGTFETFTRQSEGQTTKYFFHGHWPMLDEKTIYRDGAWNVQ